MSWQTVFVTNLNLCIFLFWKFKRQFQNKVSCSLNQKTIRETIDFINADHEKNQSKGTRLPLFTKISNKTLI